MISRGIVPYLHTSTPGSSPPRPLPPTATPPVPRTRPPPPPLLPPLRPPPLHPPRRHPPPPRDREYVLHAHQKRLVHFPHRRRDVPVHRVHQRPDARRPLVLPPPHLRLLPH